MLKNIMHSGVKTVLSTSKPDLGKDNEDSSKE